MPRLCFCALFPHTSIADLGNHIGQLGYPENIQDEGHLAVSHDGCAGECGNALELLAQRLDDDFFRVVDVIDDQTKMAVIRLQYDNVDRVLL